MNKIKVGLVFRTKNEAKNFVYDIIHGTVRESKNEFVFETDFVRFEWIPAYSNFRGKKLNFVYTIKEICSSEWFTSVVMPMLCVGGWFSTGIVDMDERKLEQNENSYRLYK